MKRLPTSALRRIPRVTTFRRPAAASNAELVEHLALHERQRSTERLCPKVPPGGAA